MNQFMEAGKTTPLLLQSFSPVYCITQQVMSIHLYIFILNVELKYFLLHRQENWPLTEDGP